MKNLVLFQLIIFSFNTISAQDMDNATLDEIFTTMSDTIQGESGRWQFNIKDVLFVCITDTNHNRMRIISPITESNNLREDEKPYCY